MNSKKVLFLTSLLALTTLAGCGKKASSGNVNDGVPTSMILPEGGEKQEETPDVASYPEQIILNHRTAAFNVGETFKLEPVSQFKYDGANLKYESKNAAVATVDDNGLITGIAAGETEVVVTDKNNPDFKTTVPVVVARSITTEQAGPLCDALNAYEAANPRDEVVQYMMREKTIAKRKAKKNQNDPEEEYKQYYYDRSDELMIFSVQDAYLRMIETDSEIRTEDGSIDFTSYDWIFHTNRYFNTLVYHQTGDVKTFYSAPTEDYMDGERCVPLYDVLDTMFSVGHTFFTNRLESLKLSDATDIAANEYNNVFDKKMGSLGDGSLVLSATLKFKDSTADQEDETNYGIPYGTPTPTDQASTWIIKNNKMVATYFTITSTYTIGEYEYLETIKVDYKYDEISEDRHEICDPDRKDYQIVDRLFDI